MNYLQSILSLDADALSGARLGYDTDLLEIFSPSPEQRLAGALSRETECTATFVAVSASIANALSVTGKGRVCAQALQTFTHLDTPVLDSAMTTFLDGGKPAAILEPLQAFLFRLALAGRLSTAFVREAGLPADRQTVHCATLCDAWRNACTAAIGLLFVLNEFDAKDRCNPASTARQPLIDLLLRAANGGHPCVEDDGCVVVPGWAERRRHERIAVNLPAQLRSVLGTFDIRIVDVSQ